jgi:hypothetical protein
MAPLTLADVVGLLGVAAYLLAYALLQVGSVTAEDGRYAALNGLGASAILYSLLHDFNLASFITQAVWLILTPVGYLRARLRRRRE